MNITELRENFKRSEIGLEKRALMVQELVLEIPKEERKSLAELYELSKKAIQEEDNVTKAGTRLSGRCYIGSQKIPFNLFYQLTCAAAGQPIKSPSMELKSHREENKTKKRTPFKRFGVLAERSAKIKVSKIPYEP